MCLSCNNEWIAAFKLLDDTSGLKHNDRWVTVCWKIPQPSSNVGAAIGPAASESSISATMDTADLSPQYQPTKNPDGSPK
jgi:hypothetical protein